MWGIAMKKKMMKIFLFLTMLILLFPIRMQLKDGGTIQYRALLYKISRVHKLIPIEEMEKEGKVKEYDDGIVVEILGFEVFNNVR